ncbi:hypothetical protein [Pseudomonas fluorescens]|jgi:hypothetical protein|uniref:hypothetical protein n=1 Tax=Pseudomonas fluorescens TaxID=294 RepID=UPI00277E9695|nr:hypothetical protein [Pseudomonas fluorescens]MDP9780319.1 hypothetical protein [Pseudomonas fluorescens]
MTPPFDTFIDSLSVTASIKNQNWAGTDDSIYISMGPLGQMQLFCEAPRVGQLIHVDIDIARMFGRPRISLGEIDGLALYQVPVAHPIASDDWALESVLIKANDIYANTSFKRINKWLRNPSAHLQFVWSGHVHFSDWKNSDHRSIDLNAQTYPIRWMPFIGDLMHWRCYDPSKIDGVGQLIGMWDGKLIGNQLKTHTSELLAPNDQSNSYTWVYTPEHAIIYKRWEHSDRANYVRHSQLGSGRPVMCAGEFRVTEHHMDHVIAMVNDASGHYRPDGGACLRYVAEKFDALGINTEHIEWRWQDTNA